MGTSTEVRHIKAAAKKHICSWCGQKIVEGESYKQWRWYAGGDAMTCKLHTECYKAHEEDCAIGEHEFDFAANPRGCNCGHSRGCERCESISSVTTGGEDGIRHGID